MHTRELWIFHGYCFFFFFLRQTLKRIALLCTVIASAELLLDQFVVRDDVTHQKLPTHINTERVRVRTYVRVYMRGRTRAKRRQRSRLIVRILSVCRKCMYVIDIHVRESQGNTGAIDSR